MKFRRNSKEFIGMFMLFLFELCEESYFICCGEKQGVLVAFWFLNVESKLILVNILASLMLKGSVQSHVTK